MSSTPQGHRTVRTYCVLALGPSAPYVPCASTHEGCSCCTVRPGYAYWASGCTVRTAHLARTGEARAGPTVAAPHPRTAVEVKLARRPGGSCQEYAVRPFDDGRGVPGARFLTGPGAQERPLEEEAHTEGKGLERASTAVLEEETEGEGGEGEAAAVPGSASAATMSESAPAAAPLAESPPPPQPPPTASLLYGLALVANGPAKVALAALDPASGAAVTVGPPHSELFGTGGAPQAPPPRSRRLEPATNAQPSVPLTRYYYQILD